jgi:hypothetical protein
MRVIMPDELSWYLHHEGETLGPMTLQQLEAQLSRSMVWKLIRIWRDGFDDWVLAGSVPELQQIEPPPLIQPVSGTPPIPSSTNPQAIDSRFLSSIVDLVAKLWVRVFILLAFLTITIPLGIWSVLSDSERASVSTFILVLSLKATLMLGYATPAIVLGAAWGWLRYSKTAWWQATGLLLVTTIGLGAWANFYLPTTPAYIEAHGTPEVQRCDKALAAADPRSDYKRFLIEECNKVRTMSAPTGSAPSSIAPVSR